MNTIKKFLVTYFLRLSALLSQIVNAVLLFGHHDQTVSARCYHNRTRRGWRVAYKLINLIFFWQDDHCRISYEYDIEFAEQLKKIV